VFSITSWFGLTAAASWAVAVSRLANRPDRVVVSKDLTVYSSNTGRCVLTMLTRKRRNLFPISYEDSGEFIGRWEKKRYCELDRELD
jgi:hypothetical protein